MEILLTIHILSAVTLMGNLTTAAFWKKRSDRSGNSEVAANTTRLLLHADLAFTGPGILGLLITGIWMTGLTGWRRFEEPWLAISFVLLVLTAIIWLAALLPLQLRMSRLARNHTGNLTEDPDYQKASTIWAALGGLLTLVPVVILVLMVFKPGG